MGYSESNTEEYIRELFDLLNSDPKSHLKGLMSPSSKTKGKISRVSFNKAIKPFIEKIIENDSTTVFNVLNSYLGAVKINFDRIASETNVITKPTIFNAVISLFTKFSSIVKYRYSSDYTVDNFIEVMKPVFEKTRANTLKNPGNSYKKLAATFEAYLDDQPLDL